MSTMQLSSLRPIVARLLRKVNLHKWAHRIYYGAIHGFKSASSGMESALDRSFARAMESGVLDGGDYYEFGVFKGYAFWYAQKTAVDLGSNTCMFYGFDSFAGLPEVSGRDATEREDFYKGQYACSKDQVIENLDRHGVDWNRTYLIEGMFDQTLNTSADSEYEFRTVAVALIDCDLYASTQSVLSFIANKIVDGSILMFDDWNCFGADDSKGQRRALTEFLDAHPQWRPLELFSYGAYGKVFEFHLDEY